MKSQARRCIFCDNVELQNKGKGKYNFKKEILEYYFIRPLESKFYPVCSICKVKHLDYYMEKYPDLF